MFGNIMAAERWSGEKFRAILNARAHKSILCASPRPYILNPSSIPKLIVSPRKSALLSRQQIARGKGQTARNAQNSSELHERLYNEALLIGKSRATLADRVKKERKEKYMSECGDAHRRMKATASLCKDNRTHLQREAEILDKRAKWIVAGFQKRLQREDEEMKECTFAPNISKTPPPQRLVDLRRLVHP